MSVAVLLLAGGRSRRFGTDKRRAALRNGVTLLRQSADNALASGLEVWVCLRADDTKMASEIAGIGARTLLCSSADKGMAHTLAEGVTEGILPLPGNTGILVALGDMPCIRPATFRAVSENLTPHSICLPQWRHQTGHPVGFGRNFYPDITALSGDRGARALLARYSQSVQYIPVADPGIVLDVDLPGDMPDEGPVQTT